MTTKLSTDYALVIIMIVIKIQRMKNIKRHYISQDSLARRFPDISHRNIGSIS